MAGYGTSDDYPDYAYADDLRRLQTAFAELRDICGTLLDETRHLAESNGKCCQPASCRCWYHLRLRKINDATQKLQNIQF